MVGSLLIIGILLLIGLSVLFYFLLSSDLKREHRRTRQELERLQKRLGNLEEGLKEEGKGAIQERTGKDQTEEAPKRESSRREEAKAPASRPTPPPQAQARPAPPQNVPPRPQPGKVTKNPQPRKATRKKSGNREWERFIGENLINKVGIAVLVLGIAFFVKYAIDQGWLGEVGRVTIGILSGAVLIGLAHRLQERFRAFSSVLAGGGVAVLYFTITIAFQEYQLFGQTAAFLIMLVITGFTVLLSLLYDKQELAVIALIGGFATPFMVSTGEGNYIVLFSYLIILNLGMLTLAYQRHWTVLNLLSYLMTIAIYGGWFLRHTVGELVQGQPEASIELPFPGSFLFGTAFFLIFYLMALLYKLRKKIRFQALDFSILISANALYFALGLSILHFVRLEHFQGLFTAALGGVNLLFAWRSFTHQEQDRNLFFALVGLTLTFLTLAAPIQLDGNHITLFWAAEAVLLLGLAQRSGIRLLKLGSITVNGLMLISLGMDWVDSYAEPLSGQGRMLPILLHEGFVTGLIAIASIGSSLHLLQNEAGERFYGTLGLESYRKLLNGFLIILGYTLPLLELYSHTELRIHKPDLQAIIMGSYHFLAASILLGLAQRKAGYALRMIAFIAAMVLTFAYLLYFHPKIYELQEAYLQELSISLGGYLFHLLLVGGVLVVLQRIHTLIKDLEGEQGGFQSSFQWFATFVILLIASMELDQLVLGIGYGGEMGLEELKDQNAMIGYPILWGASSFILMWQGLKKKIRNLRIISLSLFAITLLKLFLLDIGDIPPFGRVIAFVSLGILLLVVSFMYQRLKGLVLDDNSQEEG